MDNLNTIRMIEPLKLSICDETGDLFITTENNLMIVDHDQRDALEDFLRISRMEESIALNERLGVSYE